VAGETKNLFALRPQRAVEWEHTADGRTALIVPRFRARLLARFLLPRLKRPDFRVRLDEIGSHVWDRCDGTASVLDLAASVWQCFGGDRDGIDERVSAFVLGLAREGYVTMLDGEHEPPAA
jgi:hypothetical protein